MKTRIGPVDDPLEREADRVADEVTRMANPTAMPLLSGAPVETVRRKAVFRPDSGCSDWGKCGIVTAWDLAGGLVDDTLAALDQVIAKGAKSKHHGAVMTRFPGATAAQLANARTTLASIKAELGSDIVAKCPKNREPCVGNVFAGTTCAARADIDFCVAFYFADCREQAAAIIHEIAHHIVCEINPAIDVTTKRKREVEREGKKETIEEEVKEKTGDVYRHFPEFATLDAAQALQNPDSFAVLCLNLSKRSSCFDCGSVMQLDEKKWGAMQKRLTEEHSAPAAEEVKRKCAACEEEALHRSAASAGPAGGIADAAAQRAIDGLSGGASLSAAERAYFEPRFGHDFATVRIHDGDAAGRAAASVGARAFTLGKSIAFAHGEYRPGSASGRALLAHELAHVVQQGGGAMPLNRKCAACEAEEESTLRRAPTRVTLNTEGSCTDPRAIAEAIPGALAMARTAFFDWFPSTGQRDRARVDLLLRANFGADDADTRSTVHGRLSGIYTYLQEAMNGNVTFVCAPQGDSECSGRQGYVLDRQPGRIHICPTFFGLTLEGRRWMLVHECAHLAGAKHSPEIYWGFFGAIGEEQCRLTIAGSTREKLGNADNYARLVWCLTRPAGTEVTPP